MQSALGLVLLLALSGNVHAQPEMVTAIRTPGGGLQPQAAVDASGELHLIYFLGDPGAGDLFYIHKPLGKNVPFSAPLRVNCKPRTVVATGTIRGAQLALGSLGQLHVVWNGVGSKGLDGYARLYTAYTHLNAAKTGFEPQRDMNEVRGHVDGGGSVAADTSGHVYVVWHLSAAGQDESQGGVYLAASNDSGAQFRPARRIDSEASGQCGCCAMRAFADRSGAVYVLYRTARGNVSRDSTLLTSRNNGWSFDAVTLQKWPANVCPMSSFSISEGRQGVIGAWETQGQVWFAALSPAGPPRSLMTAAPGSGSRKYPLILSGSTGKTLLAWVEGAGWERGGAFAWQVYGRDGAPTSERGRREGVPVWSLISGATRSDGTFILFY